MSLDVLLVDLAGLASIALVVWYFFLSRRAESGSTAVGSGLQEIRIVVKGGYSPERVLAKPGVPIRLHFDRQEQSPCSEEVVFPGHGVRRSLPAFATTSIDLPLRPPGRYDFACGMDMLHGQLVVGDTLEAPAPSVSPPRKQESAGEIDPICGMRVDPARAAATSTREGRTIYFCSVGCQQRFEAGLAPRPMAPGVEQRVSLGVRRRPPEG